MLENPQSVLWILRCGAFSFEPDPRISGFLSAMLRDNMDMCFNRFRFLFSVWCLLSFIHFLSCDTRDAVGFGFFGPAISYVTVTGYKLFETATMSHGSGRRIIDWQWIFTFFSQFHMQTAVTCAAEHRRKTMPYRRIQKIGSNQNEGRKVEPA
jgi:hypothetical protein